MTKWIWWSQKPDTDRPIGYDLDKIIDEEGNTILTIYGDQAKKNEYNLEIMAQAPELLACIAALESRLKEAEAIIKPFADNAPVFNGEDEDKEIWGNPNMDLTVDNLRRAAAFLKGGDAI